ncbi:MAG: hypothetical protein R2725_13450 [Solirubrobacterales bacterium]
MGTAGSPGALFRRALDAGDFATAWAHATGLPHVDLEDAVQLVVLAGEADHPRYEALCRRLLIRIAEEREPSLHELRWTIERLQDVREGRGMEAGPALMKFARRGGSPGASRPKAPGTPVPHPGGMQERRIP